MNPIIELKDVTKVYQMGAQEVRALMFVERFSSDVEERLDGMQD